MKAVFQKSLQRYTNSSNLPNIPCEIISIIRRFYILLQKISHGFVSTGSESYTQSRGSRTCLSA